MPPPKPKVNLRLQTRPPPLSNTIIELETPVDPEEEDDDLLQLSSPSSSSSSPVDFHDFDSDSASDDISKDLAVLERLRRSVQNNLKLRPIRSATSLRVQAAAASPSPFGTSWPHIRDERSPSPSSSLSPASVYFTPVSAVNPHEWQPRSSDPSDSHGLDAALLLARLSSATKPLLIDTRPTAEYLANRLDHSVNIQAIPSLILKRSRKPGGGIQELGALRQWITTDEGKRLWDEVMGDGDWDGDVIVYDETMDERERSTAQATSWILLNMVQPLLEHGSVDFLKGGFASAQRHPYLKQHLISDHRFTPPSLPKANGKPVNGKPKPGGLFQLDISVATRPRDLPELERSAVSPKPMMSSMMSSFQNPPAQVSPSPAPSDTGFSRPPPPRRPSVPMLRKLDTKSAERLNVSLPKLQVPTRSATLAAPPSARPRSRSPSHLHIDLPPPSPPGSARLLSAHPDHAFDAFLPPPSPSFSRSSTPSSPRTPMVATPLTARPDSSQPPTTEEPFPAFAISTILPNFLYLGPEVTSEEHVQELFSHGVKRILNLAIECDDDLGLNLRERFERYIRIPMRDTVEEDNITRGVRQVCEVLDDARLHSSATYVHCKAGKSRSVTAVMAYLIHANHWTLSRAYAFVLERRKGISPNIGFVSELMTFEEQELGGKSVGVVKMPEHEPGDPDSVPPTAAGPAHGAGGEPGGGGGGGQNYHVAVGGRRQQHIRESLPPMFSHQHSYSGTLDPPQVDFAQLGDSGQEMEIKDATGRYRHARRAPVDEATLQPMRRVSKAGLESATYG